MCKGNRGKVISEREGAETWVEAIKKRDMVRVRGFKRRCGFTGIKCEVSVDREAGVIREDCTVKSVVEVVLLGIGLEK